MDIRHDIPIPSKPPRGKYPFRRMKVGDSFPVERDDVRKVRSAAIHWGKRHSKKFEVLPHDGQFGCWRTK